MSQQPSVIVVPVDGSEGASRAARYALTLAEAFQVPVELVFAFPRDPVDVFGIPTEAPRVEELEYFSADAFGRLRDQSAAKAFEATRAALGASTATIEETIVAGSPAEAVIAHTAGLNQPHIVIGSRGFGTVKELLLGSVSQRVLHHANCPVTVVR